MRLLQEPTALGLEQPPLTSLQIAFYRSAFAGLLLLFLIRRRDASFRPAMLGMVAAFGIMTALYLSALGGGPAANAILLQNTAPVWVYVLGVYVLGEPPHRRTLHAVILAMCGAGVIVIGNWPRGLTPAEESTQARVLLMAAGSGLFYAIVVLMLRHLRGESPAWLTTLNLLGGTLVIFGFAAASGEVNSTTAWLGTPSARQFAFLALFGVVQLAIPYVLFARGLKTISSQEAGIITLIEPLLNPLWAFLISPDRDTPTAYTFIGGGVLMLALAWRYWPAAVTRAQ